MTIVKDWPCKFWNW